MSYGKPIKKNFYSGGRGDIAMPAEGEMPPVLADTPGDWAGNNQQQEAAQPQEVENEVDEVEVQDEPVEQEAEDIVEEQEVAPKQRSKNADDNLRVLREARDKAERERDILMQHVMEMQKNSSQKLQPEKIQMPEEPEGDFDFSVDDDALMEGKDGKRLAQELKSVKREVRKYASQHIEIEIKNRESAIEAKIKSQYPDFDAVVNSENIQQLNEQFPELAATLKDTKDLYSKAVSAYSIMKKFGIYRDKTYDADKAIAIKNATKPRPLASVNPQQGDSPLSKANAFANGMTKDLQEQLLREMNQARKNI